MAASDSHSSADAGPLVGGAMGLAVTGALLSLSTLQSALADSRRRAANARNLNDWTALYRRQAAVADQALTAAAAWKARALEAEKAARAAEASRAAMARVVASAGKH